MAQATTTTEGEIVLAGDLTGDANAPELRASGVTPGTYVPVQRLSVDTKGRITSLGETTPAEFASAIGVATTSVEGVFSVGTGLAMSGDAIISSPDNATTSSKGVVQIGSNEPVLSVSLGVLSVPASAQMTSLLPGVCQIGTRLVHSGGVIGVDENCMAFSTGSNNSFSPSWTSGGPDQFKSFSSSVGFSPTRLETSGSRLDGSKITAVTQLLGNNFVETGSSFNQSLVAAPPVFLVGNEMAIGYNPSSGVYVGFGWNSRTPTSSASDYRVVSTTDFQTFSNTQQATSINGVRPFFLTYFAGRFTGMTFTQYTTTIKNYVHSVDGSTWSMGSGPYQAGATTSTQVIATSLPVVSGSRLIAAIGRSGLSTTIFAYTSDGISWTQASGPAKNVDARGLFYSRFRLAASGSTVVAMSSDVSTSSTSRSNVARSTDGGLTWTGVDATNLSPSGSIENLGVAASSGGEFWTVSLIRSGSTMVLVPATSSDGGATWTRHTNVDTGITYVATVGSVLRIPSVHFFKAVGSKVVMLLSLEGTMYRFETSNGISWSSSVIGASISDTSVGNFTLTSETTNATVVAEYLTTSTTPLSVASIDSSGNAFSPTSIPFEVEVQGTSTPGKIVTGNLNPTRQTQFTFADNFKVSASSDMSMVNGENLSFFAIAEDDGSWLISLEK